VLAVLGTLAVFGPATARAEAPESDVRSVARWHFHRGLALFNQGDNGGALAEFRRAYELVPNPRVRYNLGLTYAASSAPVEALEALEPLVDSAELSGEQRTHVRATIEEQRQRIGELAVIANVPGARLEVDGMRVGRLPLARALPFAVGRHLVTVSAAGYLPSRSEVLIAGRTRRELRVNLEPSEAALAALSIESNLPDVELFVDGQLAGKTPLAIPITMAPGVHVLRAARPGYRPVNRKVDLGPGVSGKLVLALEADTGTLAREGGRLALDISESEARIFIDGAPRETRHTGLSLPSGRHALRVERAGFFTADRLITIQPGRLLQERVELLPTPQYHADYARAANRQRAWAYGIGGGGALLAAASAGFLVWNAGEERDAERNFDATADSFDPGGGCDRTVGLPPSVRAECNALLEQRLSRLEDIRGREKYGWIGAGVGTAALGVGVYLFFSGDDPRRYDPRPESDVFGSLTPRISWQNGELGAGLSGRF